jgi:3-oxoacyl-[acyl-carrier-protein] synthase-3
MYLHSLGHFHPENVIDNRFLESLDIGTTDEWITSRTGICTRRTSLPLDYIRTTRNRDPREGEAVSLYSVGELAFRAASMALDRAQLQASDIGLVVAGSTMPRHASPADASVIAERLGIAAPCFDLNAACSSWVVQLHTLASMNREALPPFVMVVNSESFTQAVDYSDRSNAVLVGDATTAAILSPSVPGRARITRTMMDSDPSGWRKVGVAARGHFWQEGGAVQNFAIRKTIASLQALEPHAGDGFYFTGHQANLMMLRSVCARAGVADSRHLYNVDRFGNCGAAGAPSVISERWADFCPGDRAVVAVVGAGLTWAGTLLEFL